MAAIDFPASPTVGQIFNASNGSTYKWNGLYWTTVGTYVATPTYDETSAIFTDAGTVSIVNTPMQITTGTQIFSRSFTAVDPTHPIEVDITLAIGAGGTAASVIGALFIDGAANAVAQESAVFNTTWHGPPTRIRWRGILSAGPHTFSVRFGGNAANMYVNSSAGNPIGGGALKSSMSIQEIGIGPVGPQGPAGPSTGAIQTVDGMTSTWQPVTGTIPFGQAGAPTTAQGQQTHSTTFTPQRPDSKLVIDVEWNYMANANDGLIVALFRDGVCVRSAWQHMLANAYTLNGSFRCVLPSVAAAASIFTIRMGAQSGSTLWLNGNSTAGVQGGTMKSGMIITEQ